MNRRRKWLLIRYSFISFFLLICFFFKAEISYSATVNDYYTGVFLNGNVDSPDAFRADRDVIRPIYAGTSESVLNDIKSGGVTFTGIGPSYSKVYVNSKPTIYSNVGIYNGRKLALQIKTMNNTSPQHKSYSVYITDFLGLNYSQLYSNQSYTIAYQLLYEDTMQPVPNIYLEIPFSYKMDWATSGPLKKINFDLTTLKQLYISYNATGPYVWTKLSISSDNMLIVDPVVSDYSSNRRVPVTIISDNNRPVQIGVLSSNGADQTFFDNSFPLPHTPYYLAPDGLTTTAKNGQFISEYQINQSVIAAMDTYYPDDFSVYLEDEQQLFTTLDIAGLVIKNNQDEDITNQLVITKESDHKLKINVPKSVMQTLENNTIRIYSTFSSYDSAKLTGAYDEKNNRFIFPLTTYHEMTKNGQVTTSKKNSVKNIVPAVLSATVVDQNVFLNSTTEDLDLNVLLKNTSSNVPNDQVKLTLLTPPKRFDKVAVESVDVQVESSIIPNLVKIFNVKINVIDDIVHSAFFENQPWIINELNKQLAPKEVNKDMYVSDLLNIRDIKLENITGNQKIPPNIKGLVNLTRLSVSNSPGLTGLVPKELGSLAELTTLNLSNDNLSGMLPKELSNLKKLNVFDVAKNKFLGQLPEFSTSIDSFNVSETELTYDAAGLPSFITREKGITTNSFVYNQGAAYLQLVSPEVKIYDEKQTEIQPFDRTNRSKFDLGAATYKSGFPISDTEQPRPLLEDHIFTIKNAETNELYYEGKADSSLSIPYSKGTTYNVTMDKAEKNSNNSVLITTKIQKQKVNVAFVDETGTELHTPLVSLEGIIGESIDLTKNEEVQQIIDDLLAKHYQIKQKPDSENAVKIKEQETTVTYQLEGTLFIYSHPKKMSFGTKMLVKGLRFIKVEKARFDQPLIIWDNRKKNHSWKVTATLEKPLTSVTDPTKSLPDAIRYKYNETDIVTLSEGDSKLIAEKTSSSSNEYNLSDDWKAGKSGFQLEVPTGKVVHPGGYLAEVLWQVGDTP